MFDSSKNCNLTKLKSISQGDRSRFWLSCLGNDHLTWFFSRKIFCDSEFLSYNLMLNSGEKNRASCDKKNKYSNSCCPKKKNSKRKKTHSPPCKLNDRSLIGSLDYLFPKMFYLTFQSFDFNHECYSRNTDFNHECYSRNTDFNHE
jgi:hypothetical protein